MTTMAAHMAASSRPTQTQMMRVAVMASPACRVTVGHDAGGWYTRCDGTRRRRRAAPDGGEDGDRRPERLPSASVGGCPVSTAAHGRHRMLHQRGEEDDEGHARDGLAGCADGQDD
jgi:hypothetical protein